MKRTLFAIGMLTALTCSGLHAQSSTMRVDVPFDFAMGKTVLPAGRYAITCANSLLTVREESGKHGAMTLTTPESIAPALRRQPPDKGFLLFQRYGDEYFLSGMWTANSREGHALPKTSRQKELASRERLAGATSIALSMK
jgi:hypothetical protein